MMRIGIIGTRGIPNRHGGYEQFVEFAAPELVKRGHEVYVYNSSLHPYDKKLYKGVHIIREYDAEEKIGTAGQFIYDLNCIIDARRRDFDIILQLGYTSSSIWSFLFPKRSFLVTNMDGLEWKRTKYSKNVQRFLKHAERWAARYSDYLIADSKGIQQYLKEKYKKDSAFIAYGASVMKDKDEKVLQEKGLIKYGYDLLVARMEPENNIETVIEGHMRAKQAKPLILVGKYESHKYGAELYKKYHSDQIRFIGPVYDLHVLNNLRYFSHLYFHGHSVGGTNPSLLEAMASYALIIAHDNIFNRSVLEEDAFYFQSASDIAEIVDRDMPKNNFDHWIRNNATKIRELYSWDHIINLLENYLLHVVEAGRKK